MGVVYKAEDTELAPIPKPLEFRRFATLGHPRAYRRTPAAPCGWWNEPHLFTALS